jgi:hypothetical protein
MESEVQRYKVFRIEKRTSLLYCEVPETIGTAEVIITSEVALGIKSVKTTVRFTTKDCHLTEGSFFGVRTGRDNHPVIMFEVFDPSRHPHHPIWELQVVP